MSKRIGIMGSTGSVGEQALDVIRQSRSEFEVAALSAHTSVDQLRKQTSEFNPEVVGIADPQEDVPDDWVSGEESLEKIARMDLDLLVLAIVGAAGVKPCMTALDEGTNIALANKEVLVTAGDLVQDRLLDSGTKIIPVDSEHNALFQLIQHEEPRDLNQLILTASGGPFLDYTVEEMSEVTPDEALDHPNWDMGPKITIDSATMMNKGLEVIEALQLFDISPEKVDAVVHPQSQVHGLVELRDGSLKAHCSEPDMKLPIQYALFYPERRESVIESIDFSGGQQWEFRPIDRQKFPCFELALEAAEQGNGAPTILNASNEVAVDAFLEERIGFRDIPDIIEKTLDGISRRSEIESLDSILELDREAREIARSNINKGK